MRLFEVDLIVPRRAVVSFIMALAITVNFMLYSWSLSLSFQVYFNSSVLLAYFLLLE